jgi:hypothetical protein
MQLHIADILPFPDSSDCKSSFLAIQSTLFSIPTRNCSANYQQKLLATLGNSSDRMNQSAYVHSPRVYVFTHYT